MLTKTASILEKITEWSVYAFVLFYTVSKAMIEISFTVALISWLLAKIIKKEPLRLHWNWMLGALVLFVALSVGSAFVSQYPAQSIRGIGKHLEEVLFLVIIADTFQCREKLKRLLGFGFAVLLVTALDAVFQLATGRDFLRNHAMSYVDTHARLQGPFSDHTVFASYLIGWLSILLAFFFHRDYRSVKTKVLAVLLLIMGAFSLFHTQARGAWLSFALAILFFSIIKRSRLLVGFLLAAVTAGYFVLPWNMIVHPDAEGKEQSIVERKVLWERAVDVILARPWLGTGINTYARAHQQFDREKSWRVQNYYAHNSFLQLAADRGLPALLFFLVFMVLFLKRCFSVVRARSDPEQEALIAGVMTGIIGLLILAQVDTVFEPLQTGMFLWFLFGLGIAAMQVDAQRKEN